MAKESGIPEQVERMRREWDARAAEDAEYYVHTPDSSGAGFDESGRRNYEEQIQPYLDLLLDGRSPADCRVVEIGCGLGRITRWIAAHFKEVHGVDISSEMIARAQERLRDCPNVTLHVGSGADLRGLPDAHFDLAFSYIVFQHIPSREVIASYIRDTARVLRPGGAFRFQVNGGTSWEYRRKPKDTWLGESFSIPEVLAMLRDAGLHPLTCQDAGQQDMWISARKPRDLSRAAPELLRRELDERRAWEENLGRELTRLDVEPPELDALRNELKSRESELETARAHLAELQKAFDDRSTWSKDLESSLDKARTDLADLQREMEERTAWAKSQDADLAAAREALAKLQGEFDERTAWAQSLEAELSRTRGHFEELQKAFDERTAWALQMRDQLEKHARGKKK